MRFQEIDISNDKGIKIHFDLFENNKNKPTIIFFHGTSGYTCPNNPYHRAFGPFQEALAQKFNVLGTTIEGHGKSGGERGDFTILSYVKAGKLGIDWLKKNDFSGPIGVTGWSMGGIGSLYLAAADDRIKSAFLHNPAVCCEGDPDIFQLSSRPKFLKYVVKPTFKFLNKIGLGKIRVPISLYLNLKNVFITEENIEKWRNDPMAVKKYTVQALLSLINTPLPDGKTLKDIKIPICVLQPVYDKVALPEYTKKIFEQLGSEKKEYLLYTGPDAHHSLIRYQPETLANLAIEWFEKTL